MFERFTADARRVVVYAHEECRLLGHRHIGTEHLLLALLRDDGTPVSAALRAAGVSLAGARERIARSPGPRKKKLHGHVPFTSRARRVLEQSVAEAQRLGQDHIAPAHLLRGLLGVRHSVALRTLRELGVDLDALAARADELVSASAADAEHDAGPRISVDSRRKVARQLLYTSHSESSDRVAARVEELALQRELLVTAIRRFGRHDNDCDRERGCSCGLQVVLDGVDPPPDQGSVRPRR